MNRQFDQLAEHWLTLNQHHQQLQQTLLDTGVEEPEALQAMQPVFSQQQQTLANLRHLWSDAQTLAVGEFLQRFATGLNRSPLALHKPVHLHKETPAVRLERGLLESLHHPLSQLLNYCILHSIEPADIRQRRGKADTGQITLRCRLQQRQIIFEITDDGWGLDVDAIRQEASELQWGDSADLDALDLNQLIHLGAQHATYGAAVTATRQATPLALIQSQLQTLDGRLTASTQPGQGLTFTIELPLPLTVMAGLLCLIDQQPVAFAAASVEEIVVPDDAQLQTTNLKSSAARSLQWQGQTVPILNLAAQLQPALHQIAVATQPLADAATSFPPEWAAPLLIIRSQSGLVALEVNAITTQQSVVLQPLTDDPQTPKMQLPAYVQGYARLDDGSRVAVLDGVAIAEAGQKSQDSPIR
jgi:chemotaxis family two-component system sensor histidine kinase/response regulator PixL